MHVSCPEHQFYHGAEAEELREGIEKILKNFAGGLEGNDDLYAITGDLHKLLDSVDARDSLAYAEHRDKERARPLPKLDLAKTCRAKLTEPLTKEMLQAYLHEMADGAHIQISAENDEEFEWVPPTDVGQVHVQPGLLRLVGIVTGEMQDDLIDRGQKEGEDIVSLEQIV
jgi:hypothetical protein